MTKTNKSIVAIVAIVLALVLVAVLTIGLSACNTGNDSDSNKLTVIEDEIGGVNANIYVRLDNTKTQWILVDSYTIYSNGIVIIYVSESNNVKIVTSINHVTFQITPPGGSKFY